MRKKIILLLSIAVLLLMVSCNKSTENITKDKQEKQEKQEVSQQVPDNTPTLALELTAEEVLDSLHEKFDQAKETCQFDITLSEERADTEVATGEETMQTGSMRERLKYVDGKVLICVDMIINRSSGEYSMKQIVWGNKGLSDMNSDVKSLDSSYIEELKQGSYVRYDSSMIQSSTISKENGNTIYDYTFADETRNEDELHKNQKLKIVLGENKELLSFSYSETEDSQSIIGDKYSCKIDSSVTINSFDIVEIDFSGYEEWLMP